MSGGQNTSTTNQPNEDKLILWLEEMKTKYSFFVHKTDEKIQRYAEKISGDYPMLIDQNRLKDADPYIIAHAKSSNAVVVTQELLPQKPQTDPSIMRKIPDVCTHLGISCVDLVNFMRQEKMVF